VAPRQLAFFRTPGDGHRYWPGDAITITPFPSRTVQFHGVESSVLPPNVTRRIRDGSDTYAAEYAADAANPARPAVMQGFVSSPVPFQSYFKVHWEDMFGARADLASGTRRMTPLANPAARGRAEGQAVMAYNPWPSASQLAPAYPAAEVKAI
jgi:hypothetical protein